MLWMKPWRHTRPPDTAVQVTAPSVPRWEGCCHCRVSEGHLRDVPPSDPGWISKPEELAESHVLTGVNQTREQCTEHSLEGLGLLARVPLFQVSSPPAQRLPALPSRWPGKSLETHSVGPPGLPSPATLQGAWLSSRAGRGLPDPGARRAAALLSSGPLPVSSSRWCVCSSPIQTVCTTGPAGTPRCTQLLATGSCWTEVTAGRPGCRCLRAADAQACRRCVCLGALHELRALQALTTAGSMGQ